MFSKTNKSFNLPTKWVLFLYMMATVDGNQQNEHCREPDFPPILTYDSESLTETSRYILPTGNDVFPGFGTLMDVPTKYIDISYRTEYKLGGCNEYRNRAFNLGFEPLSVGSTCGFFFQSNTDKNRIPKKLFNVECACQRSLEGHECRKVYTYLTVLRRTGCNVNGTYVYSKVVEPLAVGCTSVRPPKVLGRIIMRP